MTPPRHLVILAKAPRLGAVKSRLAAAIGDAAAWQVYRRTMAAMIARVADDRRWRTWLAVTPDRYAAAGRFWPPALPRVAQGRGDLGARMARVMRTWPRGPVVIVGSDLPGLARGHVARAFAALATHDAAFGPAPDGGYWLVGLRRRRPLPGLFENVAWSRQTALADTLANLPAGTGTARLETLRDLDDLADWRAWRKAGMQDRGCWQSRLTRN